MQPVRRILSREAWLLLALLALTLIFIGLDVPVLRQLSGFLFFTFVPGYLLLKLMRERSGSLPAKLVLAVGLSVAYLMLSGLLLNTLLPLMGIERPLATPTQLTFHSIIVAGLVLLCDRRGELRFFKERHLSLSLAEKAWLLLPAVFPLLTIAGVRLLDRSGNNALVLALMCLIPAYVLMLAIFRRRVPERVYPAALYGIAFALLMLLALRSNHLFGSDTHVEYYFFREALSAGRWNLGDNYNVNACLSVTLLPAVYQALVNLPPEMLFKLLYPLLLTFLPLVTYAISRRFMAPFYAFLAAFFFTLQPSMLSTATNARANLAVLFFVFAVYQLFSESGERNRRLIFTIFMVCMVLSHYTTTFIAIMVLAGFWIVISLYTRFRSKSGGYQPLNLVSLFLVIVVTFVWYSLITGPAYNAGLLLARDVFRHLGDLWALDSRSEFVRAALGEVSGIAKNIKLVINWLTVAFIAIGVIGAAITSWRRHAGDNQTLPNHPSPTFTVLALVCCAALVLSIALPQLSIAYSFDRIKVQMMAFLACFCVLGPILLLRRFPGLGRWLAIAVILLYAWVPTGMVAQLTGTPESMALDNRSAEYQNYYITEPDAAAAAWLGEQAGVFDFIHSDNTFRWLASQGLIPEPQIRPDLYRLSETSQLHGYLVLRRYNIENQILRTPDGNTAAITDDWFVYRTLNLIYTTGKSDVYR